MPKATLRRVPLDRGGYAYGGRHYYGHGQPLFYVSFLDENGSEVSEHIRARDRQDARLKAQVLFAKYNVSMTKFYN